MSESTRFRRDLIAGLTVALVGLPQCLAYSMLAGLPPAYGLVTAIVPALVAAVLSRSPQVVTGPTNTTGLLVFATLVPFLGGSGAVDSSTLSVVASLTLMVGVIRIVVALLGGASLLRFLPASVLVGFTTGAGLLIGAMQLDEALGLSGVRAGTLWGEIVGLTEAWNTQGPSVLAVLVSALTAGFIVGMRRVSPHFPAALVAVVGAALIAWGAELDARGLPLVGSTEGVGGWPPFSLPSLKGGLYLDLFLPACAIVLIGTLELAVTVQAQDERPEMKRELLAQAAANVAGAFAGAFPASASLTRSALLRFAGAGSRAAPILTALVSVPFLLFFSRAIAYVPLASLAGVLLVIAAKMINWGVFGRMWRSSPVTRALLSITLLSTITLPLEWAILLGTGAGLIVHLARTSSPRVTWLGVSGRTLVELEGEPPVVVVQVSGDLHYAAVPGFIDELRQSLPRSTEQLVIDLAHAHELRFAALRALEALRDELESKNQALYLSGVSEDFVRLLKRSESKLHVTPWSPIPEESLWRCLDEISPVMAKEPR